MSDQPGAELSHNHVRLLKIESARRALTEAQSIPDVHEIRNVAEALRIYAKQQGYSLSIQNQAAELKLRAERKAGELLAEMALKPGPKPINTTLGSIGLTPNQSHRWQTEAALPENEFEEYIAATKNTARELTSREVYQRARLYQKASEQSTRQAYTRDWHNPQGTFTTDLDALATAVATQHIPPFACLYVDPPWAYSNQGTRASTKNHYPTMSVAEIAALPVEKLVAPQAHLHLWTTNGFLFECPKLFDAWGFTFKGTFIWHKPQLGLGNYWRNTHEILLLAVRGNLTARDKSLPSLLTAPREGHSVKPERVRSLVQRLSPGPYLELFGRRWAEGWTVWGNECFPSQRQLLQD